MHSYKDLTRYFGVPLSDTNFQSLIKSTFDDLTDYNVIEGNYMISKSNGIELGFTNNDATFDEDEDVVFDQGNPVFSHINIYPKSPLRELPFQVSFTDSRIQVINKAGQPSQTKQGKSSFLGSAFLIDNYKVENLVITFDYQPEVGSINFVQIRDNNLVEHLKF